MNKMAEIASSIACEIRSLDSGSEFTTSNFLKSYDDLSMDDKFEIHKMIVDELSDEIMVKDSSLVIGLPFAVVFVKK